MRHGSNTDKAFVIPPHALWHTLSLEIDCPNNEYTVFLNGQEYIPDGIKRLVHKVNAVERLIIRTKPRRYLPNYEIYPVTPDLKNADECVNERVYYITNVKTEPLE